MIWHDVILISEFFVADRTLPVLLDNLAVSAVQKALDHSAGRVKACERSSDGDALIG